jgi:hypothetical protein
MRKDVIIFTSGSSGSSVLAGTLGQKGYWLGDETKKLRFDTYENARLVDLNKELLRATGFKRHDCNDIPPPSIEKIRELYFKSNVKKYVDFVGQCNENRPWLWKDPRLSYTIHFWDRLIDLNNIDIVFIERDPYQSYAGLLLSRKVPMSFSQHNLMNSNYVSSFMTFIHNNQLKYFHLIFEDLLLHPERCLSELGAYLGIELHRSDLENVYKGSLSKTRWRYHDFFRAYMTYFGYKYLRKDVVQFPRGE